MFEQLEVRQMLASASLVGGTLTLNGDSTAANRLQVELNTSGQIVAKYNNSSKTFSKSSVNAIILRGGSKADYLAVTNSLTIPSSIYGQAGNDTVWAGGGADAVYGGTGDDQIYGRNGNDLLHGEDGNDTIDGGSGTDRYSGGNGTNRYVNAETKVASPTGTSTGSTGSGTVTPGTGGGTDPGTGGETPTGGTGELPNAGTPSAVISAQVSSVIAGHAVHVHGLTSTLNGGSPTTARYEWNFGDPNGKYNTLVGFNAAHIYDRAGSYTITLKVTNEGGKVDTVTKQVSVSADNRRTIYVSGSGSDGNSGGSPSSAIKTIGRLEGLLGGNSNIKVLFERGDTFSLTDTLSITGDNVAFGAYGSGAVPVLNWTGARLYRPMVYAAGSNISIDDMAFTTRFTDTSKDNMPDAINADGHNISVRGVQFLNVGTGLNANANPIGVLVQDSSAPSVVGVRSYFAWVEGNDHVYLGNKAVNSTREAIFRVSDNAQRLLVHGNDFTNISRSGAGDSTDTAKNTLTIQWGAYAYIAQNKLTRGPVRIGPLGEGDGYQFFNSRFNYAVLDGNRFDAPVFALHGLSHAMFKNNISTAHGYAAYTIEGFNSGYGRGVTNVSVLNNTAVNGSSEGQFIKVEGPVNGINLVNNLYVAPSMRAGNGSAAAVYVQQNDLSSFRTISNNVWSTGSPQPWAEGGYNYVSTSVWSPSGFKTPAEWNAISQVGTDIFSSASVSGSYVPSSTAANAGRVIGGVFVDANGKARGNSGPWSAGAIEA